MDPDANLAEQRELSKEILDMVDVEGFENNDAMKDSVVERAIRLSELCEALDQWIEKAGALPKDWHLKQRINFQSHS